MKKTNIALAGLSLLIGINGNFVECMNPEQSTDTKEESLAEAFSPEAENSSDLDSDLVDPSGDFNDNRKILVDRGETISEFKRFWDIASLYIEQTGEEFGEDVYQNRFSFLNAFEQQNTRPDLMVSYLENNNFLTLVDAFLQKGDGSFFDFLLSQGILSSPNDDLAKDLSCTFVALSTNLNPIRCMLEQKCQFWEDSEGSDLFCYIALNKNAGMSIEMLNYFFIKVGINIFERSNGTTSLVEAVRHGNTDMLEYLLENADGLSMEKYEALSSQEKRKLLLMKSCKTCSPSHDFFEDHANNMMNNLLYVLSRSEQFEQFLEILLKHNLDILSSEYNTCTSILMEALFDPEFLSGIWSVLEKHYSPEQIAWLVNLQIEETTPLFYAIANLNYSAVEQMIPYYNGELIGSSNVFSLGLSCGGDPIGLMVEHFSPDAFRDLYETYPQFQWLCERNGLNDAYLAIIMQNVDLLVQAFKSVDINESINIGMMEEGGLPPLVLLLYRFYHMEQDQHFKLLPLLDVFIDNRELVDWTVIDSDEENILSIISNCKDTVYLIKYMCDRGLDFDSKMFRDLACKILRNLNSGTYNDATDNTKIYYLKLLNTCFEHCTEGHLLGLNTDAVLFQTLSLHTSDLTPFLLLWKHCHEHRENVLSGECVQSFWNTPQVQEMIRYLKRCRNRSTYNLLKRQLKDVDSALNDPSKFVRNKILKDPYLQPISVKIIWDISEGSFSVDELKQYQQDEQMISFYDALINNQPIPHDLFVTMVNSGKLSMFNVHLMNFLYPETLPSLEMVESYMNQNVLDLTDKLGSVDARSNLLSILSNNCEDMIGTLWMDLKKRNWKSISHNKETLRQLLEESMDEEQIKTFLNKIQDGASAALSFAIIFDQPLDVQFFTSLIEEEKFDLLYKIAIYASEMLPKKEELGAHIQDLNELAVKVALPIMYLGDEEADAITTEFIYEIVSHERYEFLALLGQYLASRLPNSDDMRQALGGAGVVDESMIEFIVSMLYNRRARFIFPEGFITACINKDLESLGKYRQNPFATLFLAILEGDENNLIKQKKIFGARIPTILEMLNVMDEYNIDVANRIMAISVLYENGIASEKFMLNFILNTIRSLELCSDAEEEILVLSRMFIVLQAIKKLISVDPDNIVAALSSQYVDDAAADDATASTKSGRIINSLQDCLLFVLGCLECNEDGVEFVKSTLEL